MAYSNPRSEELMTSPKYAYARERYFNQKTISEEDYNKLHKDYFNPIDIKINCDLFEKEIEEIKSKFIYWGLGHEKKRSPKRYGLPLVDLNEKYKPPFEMEVDSNVVPLDKWLYENPDYPILYQDYTEINDSFRYLTSLKKYLDIFEPYIIKSCILWWDKDNGLAPHIDGDHPTDVIRLWGTNDPKNYQFKFWDDEKQEYIRRGVDAEPGRLYIPKTVIPHEAYATADNVYTFFFALHPDAYDLVKEHLI
jgi:hypothetical protein